MSAVNTETSEQYEECEVCGAVIDTFDAGYFKSDNDEIFRHRICHENGEPPEGYVWEWEDDGSHKACHNHQFNCGHSVYCPLNEKPMFCPECNSIVYEDGEWKHENADSGGNNE